MNGLNLDESLLLKQYRQTKDLKIERLLSQYGTSLKDMRELYPQLTDTIKQRQLTTTFPTQPLFFTPSEAQQMGLGLQEGWMLKMTPTEGNGGFTSSLITPEKWEITENDLYISPSGDQFSRADMEALLGEPTGAFEATPQALTIENLTEEGKSAYQEYQEAGGELDVKGWVDLRERQQLETEQVFGKVFPEQDISEVIDYMNENREAFLADIREIGPTEDVVALLKAIPFDDGQGGTVHLTDEEIQELFGVTAPYIPENWLKDAWDAIILGGAGFASGTAGRIFGTFPSIAATLGGALKELAYGVMSIPGQVGTFLGLMIEGKPRVEAATEAKEIGREAIEPVASTIDQMISQLLPNIQETAEQNFMRIQADQDAFEEAHPELIPKPAYLQNPFEHPELFKDPGYYAYSFSSSLVYSLTVMGTMVAVSAVATPIAGVTAGVIVAGGPEAASMTEELVRQGVPFQEAAQWGELYGLVAGGVETLSDLPFLGLVFKPLQKVTKPMWDTIFRGVSSRIAKKVIAGLIIPQGEALEEVITQVAHNAILKHYDETQSILEGVSHAYIQAVIATLPFGIIGGKASFNTFYDHLSPQVQVEFNRLVGQGIKNGLTRQQAQVYATNELARFDEYQAGLSEAIEAAQEEYWEEHPEIKRPSIEPVIPDLAEGMLEDMRVADEIAKRGVPVTPEVITYPQTAYNPQLAERFIRDVNENAISPEGKLSADQANLIRRYYEAMWKSQIAEKHGGESLEIARIYEEADWESYSRQRGYSEAEIANFKKGLELYKEGLELGIDEDTLHSVTFDVNETLKQMFPDVATQIEAITPEIATGKPYTATVYRGYKEGGVPVDEGLFGKGTYYTTNREYAETYDGKEVMTVNLKNPFVIQTQAEAENFWNETTRPARQEAINEGKTVEEADELAAQAATDYLKERGHDGLVARDIIEKGDEIVVFEPEKAVEVPTAEAGMPEAGLQPSMLEEVPAKEVKPAPTGKLVQARMDDYLRLREYNSKATTDRIAEIKKALETKGRSALGLKGNLRLELARLEALQEVDAVKNIGDLDTLIKEVQAELSNRELPYHGGAKNLFKGYTIRQLEEMLNVYNQARQTMQAEVPAVSPIKAEDIPVDVPALTNTQLTHNQIQKTIDLFKEAIAAPNTDMQRAAAIELRKHVFAQRAKLASESAEAMIAEGMNPEEAIKVAEQQFMTGKLPDVTTDYFNDLTQEMRNVLFAKVYNYWKDKSWTELISTFEALTNALAGKSIARVKGIGTKYFPDGGSAWDRLARVFIGDMEVLEALDKGKSLRDIIEGVLLETGRGSVALDQQTVTWLKELSTISEEDKLLLTKPLSELTEVDVRRIAESWFYQRRGELNTLLKDGVISQEEYKLQLAIAKDRVFPYKPIAPIVSYPSETFEQLPLLTLREKGAIVRTLKNIGMTIIDIGNFIRANKASFDMSFWRQVKTLIPGNPSAFYRSNVEAWKSLVSEASAEANWEWVKRQPSFPYYTEMVQRTGQDFLRMFEAPKGTAQWQAAEEFGYLTEERLIPRITAKLPWIKVSGRAFVVGTNTMTILTYNKCLESTLRRADMIATGKIKLEEGEGFSIQAEMDDYGKAIAWMSQRASLGKARVLAPEASALFFAPRSKLGRWLTPKLLIDSNPRVRAFAWKNLSLFVGTMASFVMLGYWLGLWDVERDPRNAEFMSIRIGNLRIDPWAGNRQFLVLYTRLISGTGLSSVTGQEYEVNPIGALTSFFRTSLAPLSSILLDFWTGKNFLGEEVDIANPKQWIDRIAPFAVQDIYEAFQDDWQNGLIAILPAIFGEGVQTYTGDWRENWAKLGLPKYPENTGYGIYEPVYDLADFWADTASQLRGVDPATLTESKGYPEYVRSIAQALQIIDEMETLPNKRLTSLNADPEEGTTFVQYHQMWQERQKIVASGDEEALQAFDADERTRNAYLGNMTQAQYTLLTEYHSLPESQKADFLGRHPELYANPREDWLRSHPEENALLVLWDKAKIYSLAALDKISSLAQSLGIPENAVATRDLDAVAQLKLKNKEQFDLLDAYSGLDDEFKGPDGLTARDIAIQELYADNPEFRDDMRRIEALNVGTDKNPTPDSIIEGWVERGQVVDEFGASSAETKLWLIDNKEVHQWALENGLLTDTGEDWNESILRLDVQYRDEFEQYDAYGRAGSPSYIANDTARADAREAMLFDKKGMTSFGVAYYTINALQKNIPDNLVTTYVDYYGVRKKEGVDYSKTGWYDDDWHLIENKNFYDTMVKMGLWQERDFTKVPTREVFKLYQTYYTKHEGEERLNFRVQHPELDAWLVYAKQYSYTSDAARDIYSKHPDKFLAYWPR